MLHTNNPIIQHKAGLLNLAEELGNVSRTCQAMGVSRYQNGVDKATSITPKQKPCHRKQIGFMSDFIKQF